MAAVERAALAGPSVGRAPIARYAVQLGDGQAPPQPIFLITKVAPLIERLVLDILGRQHQAVPFSCTPDLVTDAPALVCERDCGVEPPVLTAALVTELAAALAGIHHRNRGRHAQLSWLPRADRGQLSATHLGDWRLKWSQANADPNFVHEFGAYYPALEQAEERFFGWLDAQWQTGDALTLIHGDMHRSQVLVAGEHVTIIDWEHAHYGPLYLDLPNVFTGETAAAYWEAFERLGDALTDVQEQFRQAGRYVGFKYLGYGLTLWRDGARERAWVIIHSLIERALRG